MLNVRAAQRGLSLIELMFTIAVFGILIMLAAPSFFEWQQSSQIRAAAEAVQNGLQLARNEAISRNVPVQIAIGPRTGWTVAEANAPAAAVQTRVHEEGTPNANFVLTPDTATTVTFTPLGGVTANVDDSAILTRIDIDNPSGGNCQSASTAGPMRCLRILVTGGGSIRMCDPKFDAAAIPKDPRAC
jgi:type IV fimbrial biogenesis protein FimT